MKSHQEQEVRARVGQVRGKLEDLAADLRLVDDEVERLRPQREQHELLDRACGSLEKLDELGAGSLFWGESYERGQVADRLREARRLVNDFQEQLGELDEQRRTILDNIGREEQNLGILGEDLYYIREEEERRKAEWIVERDINAVSRRDQRMAWARGGEEDRRFHKSLAACFAVSLLLGALLPLIKLPLPKPFVPEDMPRRLAQLVRPEQAKPLPQPTVPDSPAEQPEPVEEPDPIEPPQEVDAIAAAEPTPTELPGPPGPEPAGVPAKPQRNVGKAGILAFKDKFASLARDDIAPRLGADARYGDADDVSRSAMPSRSMLTTNAPGSSGGIHIGRLSRNVGGAGGGPGGTGGIQGVPVGRATSTINTIGGGGGRPRARGGQAPSRTDEEIQIVFDRYKAAFYRMYNRELRNDPTLRGQMVLRLTIEPDGSVSMCKLQSSDMKAPVLAGQVVARVLTINFGAKEGVEALTIVYPIDFLPKA